eukprot:TRINITY_DN8020_c0_g4_i2.p1 TRINITY_DN8020_c0_g4~~TRINITY_DN8020_c0_g4_i2.p1  ORF type:complete len:100 (+),score=11.15 TRINITY_DN8020_c0_g4_i2:183-482(+)
MAKNPKLTPEQYSVCWKKATERPFSGALLHNKAAGTYKCVNCSADLFTSDFKFDSGSGWPSFWSSIDGALKEEIDVSHGMRRIEIMCAAVCAYSIVLLC